MGALQRLVNLDIVIPVVGTGKDREKLLRETKEDSTLETIRTFADNKDKGYRLENGFGTW